MLRQISHLTIALAGFLTLTAPASASFDDLRAMAPLLPASKSPMAFVYTSPMNGFSVDSPVLYGPSERILALALFDGAPDPVTGVDFSRAGSVLIVGDPPSELTVLGGEPGFLDDVPAAMRARGFEESVVDGLSVFARGEDYANDVAAAREPDPLGRGMAKSQRLALGENFLLRAAGWPETNAALATLAAVEAPAGTVLWQASLDALSRACQGCWLNAATGWHIRAFLGTSVDVATMLDPEALARRLEEESAQQKLRIPPFPHALLAMGQGENSAYVQIALPYDNADLAQRAADAVAERLIYFPLVPATPQIDVENIGQTSVAVLTIPFPLEEASNARDLFGDINAAIMQRRFDPLAIL